MLKWTARAFATAAALQLGVVAAQDVDVEADPELTPPPAAGTETDLDVPAVDESSEEAEEAIEQPADEIERTEEALERPANEAREEANEAAEEANEIRDARRANEENPLADDRPVEERQTDVFQAEPQEGLAPDQEPRVGNERDAGEQQFNQGMTQREARFAPNAQQDEFIRRATEHLEIDDETRSRYRFHNGEWWFQTRSGNWKIYRNGTWENFDPTTYQARPAFQGQEFGYAQPQTYGSSDGYYYQSRPYYRSSPYTNYGYNNHRPYSTYRPNWDNRYGYDRGYYGGYGGGWQGYNPGNDRYYGHGPYGRPYSLSGDQYRGGIIGSEIGGRIGGRTGAILGGAIGVEAAD